MTGNSDSDAALDRALAALRAAPPALPEGLRAAVLRDAAAVQAGFVRPGLALPNRAPFWSGLWAALGGVAGGAALAGVAVAGVALGMSGVLPYGTAADPGLAAGADSPFGGYAALLEEG